MFCLSRVDHYRENHRIRAADASNSATRSGKKPRVFMTSSIHARIGFAPRYAGIAQLPVIARGDGRVNALGRCGFALSIRTCFASRSRKSALDPQNCTTSSRPAVDSGQAAARRTNPDIASRKLWRNATAAGGSSRPRADWRRSEAQQPRAVEAILAHEVLAVLSSQRRDDPLINPGKTDTLKGGARPRLRFERRVAHRHGRLRVWQHSQPR